MLGAMVHLLALKTKSIALKLSQHFYQKPLAELFLSYCVLHGFYVAADFLWRVLSVLL